MSNSHTPGPWSAGLLEEDGPWAVGTENGSVAIAKMIGAPGQHNEANARLMAAAPEVLEALKELFADYKELADSGDAGFWSLEDTPQAKKALAAISKAEGR